MDIKRKAIHKIVSIYLIAVQIAFKKSRSVSWYTPEIMKMTKYILSLLIVLFSCCNTPYFNDYKYEDEKVESTWTLQKIKVQNQKVVLEIQYEIKNKMTSNLWFYGMAHGNDWKTMNVFLKNDEMYIKHGIVCDVMLFINLQDFIHQLFLNVIK
ncbi:MAG: hypothetical protein LBQ14_08065 [Treponema sp.]|jgi:hypothetical protein|nr:hypothetical protein [Treponema sp.]